MSNKQIVIKVQDWSKIDLTELPYSEELFCYPDANSAGTENLGIWFNKDKNCYWTSGYSGICVLKDRMGNDFTRGGNKIILVVEPRFNASAFSMLAKVICDDEYDEYIRSLKYELFEFYNEAPIKIEVEHSSGELLLAFSFIKCCYGICSRLLNHNMFFYEENLSGKVRGRIDFPVHLKKNVFRGREDRIYCKYPYFSENTVENRILKKALDISEKILCSSYRETDSIKDIREMLFYCKRRLDKIPGGEIRRSDFSAVSLKGFNSRYAPAIKLAKLLIDREGLSVNPNADSLGYAAPYAIRMEAVFEFYVRSQIKSYLKNNKIDDIKLDHFRVPGGKDPLITTENRCYLMHEYIPDIALMKFSAAKDRWEYTAVLDVKYQRNHGVFNEVRRHNTHQLMFYTLLLNVNKCGFIFPKNYGVNLQNTCEQLELQCGNADSSERYYSEFYISDLENSQACEFERMVNYARNM